MLTVSSVQRIIQYINMPVFHRLYLIEKQKTIIPLCFNKQLFLFMFQDRRRFQSDDPFSDRYYLTAAHSHAWRGGWVAGYGTAGQTPQCHMLITWGHVIYHMSITWAWHDPHVTWGSHGPDVCLSHGVHMGLMCACHITHMGVTYQKF